MSADGEAAAVEVVAALAGLPLPPERLRELAAALPAVRAEHAELRALPQELEPQAVFDPRWD